MQIYHGLPKETASQIELLVEAFYKKPTEEGLTCLCNAIVDAYENNPIEDKHKPFWWSYYNSCQKHLTKGYSDAV